MPFAVIRAFWKRWIVFCSLNVSVPAQIAGVAAMKNHKEYLEETRMFLKE